MTGPFLCFPFKQLYIEQKKSPLKADFVLTSVKLRLSGLYLSSFLDNGLFDFFSFFRELVILCAHKETV